MTTTVLRGVLGWGNRKSGLEAYGPGGRWGEGREGDLLGDALDRAGAHEGADLLVIAVDRFGDLSVIADVLALLTERGLVGSLDIEAPGHPGRTRQSDG